MYKTGYDFWRDLAQHFGAKAAVKVANEYLDMQIHCDDPEELTFCKELYAAVQSYSAANV